jgi:hypothetical protein
MRDGFSPSPSWPGYFADAGEGSIWSVKGGELSMIGAFKVDVVSGYLSFG